MMVCNTLEVRMELSGPLAFSLDRIGEVGGPGLQTGQHSDANTVFVCKVRTLPSPRAAHAPSSYSLARRLRTWASSSGMRACRSASSGCCAGGSW